MSLIYRIRPVYWLTRSVQSFLTAATSEEPCAFGSGDLCIATIIGCDFIAHMSVLSKRARASIITLCVTNSFFRRRSSTHPTPAVRPLLHVRLIPYIFPGLPMGRRRWARPVHHISNISRPGSLNFSLSRPDSVRLMKIAATTMRPGLYMGQPAIFVGRAVELTGRPRASPCVVTY